MVHKQSKKLSGVPTVGPNILVVCHGNLCRSPLAGCVLAGELGESRVRDRGLSGSSGQLAAKKVRLFAKNIDYDLSSHRSKPVTQEDVDWAGLVVYMDSGNYKRLAEFRGSLKKAVCLGQYIGLSRIADPNYIPYGDKLDAVLQSVVDAALALAKKVS